MPDRLPALRALQVFDAAARHLSYSRAAEDLFLTQSAVSHQIKALEAELGTRLFRRAGRAMLLTSEGQRFYTHIRDGLASFAKGVATLRTGRGPLTLNISATPSLAAGWLVPRLSDFYHRHPDIDVNLRATTALADFDRDEVDLALRYGAGQWPGMHAEKLLSVEVFPVCSPLYRGGKLPARPIDLLQGVLLHVSGLPSWEEWFKSANVNLEQPLHGPRFSDYMLAVQAAKRGQGVLLGRGAFVAEKLASGQLVRLMRKLPSLRTFDYYIVYPQGSDLPRKSRAFRDWMLEQARDTLP
jgi:LysR family transcriptional regulator, glycine cleavage system transcriptional activator